MARRWLRRPAILAIVILLAIGVALGSARSAGAQGILLSPASPWTVEPLPSLPWLPLNPGPRPFPPDPLPATPPFLPPAGPEASAWWPVTSERPALADLPHAISALQQALDSLAEWVKVTQQAAAGALARMIRESPGNLPPGGVPPDLIGQVSLLPRELASVLDALLAKLLAPAPPGGVEARHQEYTASSPALAHEAAGIVATDEIVTDGAVQQAAATRAVSVAAAAAAGDSLLPATVSSAHETGAALLRGAHSLPSSRAGIELLVAGVGAGMQQQADLSAAVADRLTVLAQQTVAVSQQIGALAATAGALAVREAERDRQALDARLGLADALGAGGQMFQQVLAATGEPSADEIRLDPLY